MHAVRLLIKTLKQIGKVCVLELAKKNAHVIVASRTPSKALAVIEEIKAETKSDKIEFIQLDLLSLASVTKFISEFKAKNLPLHLLLNNAGVMACPFALSEDGIESQFATNHVCIDRRGSRVNRLPEGTDLTTSNLACTLLPHYPIAPNFGTKSA
jgi:NAD(P)-dependent dehydrogenase (short-subunit alcohol dehydrogenase family)